MGQQSTSLDWLIARAIQRSDVTACLDPDLLRELAQLSVDGHPEHAESARVRLRSHYGDDLNLSVWRKAIQRCESAIIRARNEAAIKAIPVKSVEALPDSTASPREFVLAGLRQTIERCMQAEPVLDREGLPTGQFTFQAMPAIRAFELFGKEHGMFIDRSKIDLGIKDAIERAQPEDIKTLLGEMEQRRARHIAEQAERGEREQVQ